MNERKGKFARTITGDLAIKYLEAWPKVPTLTLAKKIYAENPEHFKTVETARSAIRTYRGQNGTEHRKYIPNKHFTEPGSLNPFSLPESFAKKWEPYHIPDIYKSGIICSDLHFPYQDNRAISAMLEHTIAKRKIDFIFINGDGLDCLSLSKYSKDPSRPSLNDEIWLWVEFLNILQFHFPGVKIIWKLGNHEERLELFLRVKAPELLDMSEWQFDDIIKKRGVEGVKVVSRQIAYAGRLPIVHSHEFNNKSTSQVNPARGLFTKALSSVLGAHSHVSSSHSETDINGKLMSTFSIGCLCELHPEWALLNRWNHGFCFIELDGQEFSIDNMKIYNGKVYHA
jgi:hypothetical protein